LLKYPPESLGYTYKRFTSTRPLRANKSEAIPASFSPKKPLACTIQAGSVQHRN
jgi:hypothetical protein